MLTFLFDSQRELVSQRAKEACQKETVREKTGKAKGSLSKKTKLTGKEEIIQDLLSNLSRHRDTDSESFSPTNTIKMPYIGQEDTQEKNKLESWYVYFGLGYANPTYPGELDGLLNDLADLPGVTHVSIGMDIIGFYWPLGRQTILGGVVNAVGDRYEESGDYIQINGYTFAASIMHFFNDTIGRGFLVRGDLGLAGLALDTNVFYDCIKFPWICHHSWLVYGYSYFYYTEPQSLLLLSMELLVGNDFF